ncbi:MAG: hypothetical protein ABW328_01860 [Ilumatobacteraceae bacterium]
MDFLERNVIGRAVVSAPVTAMTNDGATEVTYVDQNLFGNLTVRADGFSFDLTSITLGRRYGVDEHGEPVELAGSMDAVRVYRYDMTERSSTGELLGFGRFVSSTNVQSDPLAGTCFVVRMTLDGDELIVEDTQIGYGDFPARGGRRRPVALDGTYRYSVSDGQLTVQFDQSTYDVDPASLQRTPTGEEFPTQHSEEHTDRDGQSFER